MSLTDVTGVFSRYFVVGFFLPAYISLVALWLSASTELVPNSLEAHSQATELLVLGAVALVAAMALSGISYYVTRVYEGYPLERIESWPVLGLVYAFAIKLQRARFDDLLAIRDDEEQPQKARNKAAWSMDRYFPRRPEALLPTRIGNAIRAFESHSNVRWGLDGVTIWPRVEALLGADERELLVDARTNFSVFINAATGAFLVGITLVVDQALNTPQPRTHWPLYLIPFIAGYVLYRAAIGPALEWGDAVRSSTDLHRLEIYEKLGVRKPTSFSDERELAAKVNRALLYGQPLLTDDLWRTDQDNSEAPAVQEDARGIRIFGFVIGGGG